ncbi:MAG: stage II sporulation protein M [Myxococcaceae bacterium]
MAEALTTFVSRRKPDWDTLSALLSVQRSGTLTLEQLEDLDRLYRRAAADLAKTQSLYPGTDAHRFLNQLCAQAYGQIYQRSANRWDDVRAFFRREFPETLRSNLRFVAVSGSLFWAGALLGALAILWDPTSTSALIPAGIRESVNSGEMWTDHIFAMGPPSAVASAIATNNLSVTIAAFATGIFGGLGSAYFMLYNGLHLGSVVAFCAQAGMGHRLLAFIGAHGPVELTIIVIAGAAGLKLGHALVAPGERPRAQALTAEGTQAVRLVLGCAPFLAAIAIVEGFVSPGEFFAPWMKGALGVLLALLFWIYLLLAGREPGTSAAPAGSDSTFRRSR